MASVKQKVGVVAPPRHAGQSDDSVFAFDASSTRTAAQNASPTPSVSFHQDRPPKPRSARPASALSRSGDPHAATAARAAAPSRQSSHASQQTSLERAASDARRAVSAEEVQQLASRKDRHTQALKLWREWAVDALGPMGSDPKPDDLQTKTKKLKQLERKCAEVAARAQRRLELSASLRNGGKGLGLGSLRVKSETSVTSHSAAAAAAVAAGQVGGGGGGGAGFGEGSLGASVSGGGGFQEMMWSAKERRKQRTYQVARDMGKAERAWGAPDASPAPASSSSPHLSLGAHSMLDAIMSGAAMAPSPSPGSRRVQSARPSNERRSSAPVGIPPWGSPNAGGGGSSRRGSSSTIPADENSNSGGAGCQPPGQPLSISRQQQGLSTAPVRGSVSMSALAMQQQQSALELEAEAEALRAQLDAAHAEVESQSEVAAQLRDTVDLLRARLHGQSQREVENQRRLQQHTRLEPLFDRLAESFSFQTPEEVINRLEMLEEDKMGTFDQLLLTQEEVGSLQAQVREANKRVETVRTQLTTEGLKSSSRLQAQNEELRAELESVEGLNVRLTERQGQLVQLQTAVLELWGRCQADPAFMSANSDDDGGRLAGSSRRRRGKAGGSSGSRGGAGAKSASAGASGGSAGASGGEGSGGDGAGEEAGNAPSASSMQNLDPLSVMALINEYVISRSPALSSRHYLDTQRVANRVWSHHFRHKAEIRGKVVETFEQLSTMADIMADKIRVVTEQLDRSKENEKFLASHLKRVEAQRRSLELELERRNQLVRDLSGVPRKQRPQSAIARTMEVVGPAAMLLLRSSQQRQPQLHSSLGNNSSGSSSYSPGNSAGGLGGYSSTLATQASGHSTATSARSPTAGAGAATAVGGSPLSRPQSAPVKQRPASARGPGHVPPEGQGGATPRQPRQQQPQGQGQGQGQREVRVSQGPAGDHWSTLASQPQHGQHAAPASMVGGGVGRGGGSSGALFQVGSSAAAAAAAGSAGSAEGGAASGATSGSPAAPWTPPKKTAIEASFLQRLQRAASVSG